MIRDDFSRELDWCRQTARRRFKDIPEDAWTARIIAHSDGAFQISFYHSFPKMRAVLIEWNRSGSEGKGFIDSQKVCKDGGRPI